MQRAYVTALYDIIKNDPNVISCLSDSGTDYDALIAREFPDRVINFGISENNQIAAAAGLSAAGKIPFVYTTSAFIAYRSYEFLRDDICLQNRNVKLIGMGTGVAWSTLGATHHSTEDIALLRSLPNLTVFSPATPKELEQTVHAAYHISGPVYIRMGMSGEKELFEDDYRFIPGKNIVIRDGCDATVFSTGSFLSELAEAAEILDHHGISLRLIHVPTLKPADEKSIISECSNQKMIISAEEHNIIGGLGSAIAEIAAENGLQIMLRRIGLNDCFANGFGTKNEVLALNGLNAEGLCGRIIAFLTSEKE